MQVGELPGWAGSLLCNELSRRVFWSGCCDPVQCQRWREIREIKIEIMRERGEKRDENERDERERKERERRERRWRERI